MTDYGMPARADELTVEAAAERLTQVQAFLDERLEAAGCPMRAKMQLGVAVEEIFVNIASYAYAPETGSATIRIELFDAPRAVTVSFFDSGRPYDPLSREDPDVTLPAQERGIGGLGILMTKKLMDGVRYEYRGGQNILTLEKRF